MPTSWRGQWSQRIRDRHHAVDSRVGGRWLWRRRAALFVSLLAALAPSVASASAAVFDRDLGAATLGAVAGGSWAMLAATPSATPGASYFAFKAVTATREGSPVAQQEVTGMVYDRSGKGMEGLSVRVWSGTWQALDTTKNGAFKFVLQQGQYQVQLQGVRSEEGRFSVEARTKLALEFREVAATTAVATVTAPPASTATVRRIPTATPATPSATPSPSPSPVLTPLPEVGTPIAIDVLTTGRAARTPTPVNVAPFLTLPGEIDLSPDVVEKPMLWGAIIAAAGSLFVAGIAAIRR